MGVMAEHGKCVSVAIVDTKGATGGTLACPCLHNSTDLLQTQDDKTGRGD